MKYPYIGKGNESGTVVMMVKPECGLIIKSKTWATKDGKFETSIDETYITNITHEYLQNTYGKVQSPEHAEFIIELAVNAGIDFAPSSEEGCPRWFAFIDDDLYFIDVDRFTSENRNKITIPLPPKADKQELSEWPQVGDDVSFSDLLQHYDEYRDNYCNKVSKVIARFNSSEGEFITVHREYCAVMTVRVDRVLQDGALIKPRTPEEEFASELIKKYKHLPNHEQVFAIARDVIDNAIAKTKKA